MLPTVLCLPGICVWVWAALTLASLSALKERGWHFFLGELVYAAQRCQVRDGCGWHYFGESHSAGGWGTCCPAVMVNLFGRQPSSAGCVPSVPFPTVELSWLMSAKDLAHTIYFWPNVRENIVEMSFTQKLWLLMPPLQSTACPSSTFSSD